MTNGEIVEKEEINLKPDNVRNCEEAIPEVKQYKKIIECKKRGIPNLAYKLGLVFKQFKEYISSKKYLRKL